MNNIHFTLMGKGGVGKSMISWLLAQYLRKKDAGVYCADTDPVNATFYHFSALEVDYIEIMRPNMTVDTGKFDDLIERLMKHDGASVVDCGASSFLPLVRYLADNEVFGLLAEAGHQVIVHAPLVGGSASDETIRGLQLLFDTLKCKVVVWENEYFGPIQINNIRLSDASVVKKNASQVAGVIQLKELDAGTYGADIREAMANKLTFDEAQEFDSFRLMRKQRLKMFERQVYEQLSAIGLE
jgi:hypothetical protein